MFNVALQKMRQEVIDQFLHEMQGKGLVVEYAEFYDRQTYTDNSTTTLAFFNEGQSNSKNKYKTNMPSGGKLATGHHALLLDLQLLPITSTPIGLSETTLAANVSDAYLLGTDGYAELSIDGKPRQKIAPLGRLSSRTKFEVSGGVAGTTTADTDATRVCTGNWNGPVFEMLPKYVGPNQGWQLDVSWNAAVNLSANCELQFIVGALYAFPG